MSNNNNAAIQVLAGGAGPGANTDCRLYSTPRTIRVVGAVGDVFLIQGSVSGSAYFELLTRQLTSADLRQGSTTIAQFVFTSELAFNYIRITCLSGNSGATATATITAEPLSAFLLSVLFTVGTNTTPSAFVDLRTFGGPRTYIYEGIAGDEVLIEGSDDGVTVSCSVVQRAGAGWGVLSPLLCNYARITRLQGTTGGARAGVVAPPNVPGGQVQSSTPVTIATGIGSLGAAASTVDVASLFFVNQTSAIVTLADMRQIPAPTDTAAGRRSSWVNVGTQPFTIGDGSLRQGVNLMPGQGCSFVWNGTAWVMENEPRQDWIQAGAQNITGSVTRRGRRTQYTITALAAGIVITVDNTGAMLGDEVLFTRTAPEAQTAAINNAAAALQWTSGATRIGFVLLRFDGTNFLLAEGGQQ